MIAKIKSTIRRITPQFALSGYHYLLAFVAAARFGFPSNKLTVIGVTGTNGKSTTVELVAAILKEAGYKVALSSTIKFEIAGQARQNALNNSMPGRFTIQKLLAQAVNEKCDYAVVEVTSEGILQHRHRFINFAGAVITNLTPEHIERHKGFDNYRKAKQQLFNAAKRFHVINCDDENAKYFVDFKAKRKICYGLVCSSCPSGYEKIHGNDARAGENGIKFSLMGVDFESSLKGEFNIYNCLAAIAVAVSQNIEIDVCRRALARIGVISGRMEKVSDSPAVYVDFAFTPNALEKVYSDLRADCSSRKGRLICLLGAAGGGRDRWKRPILGEIAAKKCDEIILANEDPWDENPQTIINEIKVGVLKAGFAANHLHEIIDRRMAIRKALESAGSRDIVILTGKGSMLWTFLENGKKIPWDEKKVVLEEVDCKQKINQ